MKPLSASQASHVLEFAFPLFLDGIVGLGCAEWRVRMSPCVKASLSLATGSLTQTQYGTELHWDCTVLEGYVIYCCAFVLVDRTYRSKETLKRKP